MSPAAGLARALAERNVGGWPSGFMPKGMPVRSDYLPKEFEPGHVIRDADGLPTIRLVDAGDRLAFWLPEVGGSLVNPKGPGLRALGFVTTIARGAAYYAAAYKAADLQKGRPVDLRREPDNPHGGNAVALHAPGAHSPFGYVQRGRAASVARRMDAGEVLAAISLRGPGPARDDDSTTLLVGSIEDLTALLRD